MNALILTFAILLVFPLTASASAAAAAPTHQVTLTTIPVSIKAEHKIDDHISNADKAKMFCYQLAAKATFVSEEKIKARWFESMRGESHVWRVSRLSTGLTCRVLIKNGNTDQFGPGARYLGCECNGNLQVVK